MSVQLHTGVIEALKNAQAANIEIDKDFSLRIVFVYGYDAPSVILELRELIHFSVSKDPDDNDGYYLVGDIRFKSLHDGGKQELLKNHFPFRNKTNEILTFQKNELYSLEIEGDVCVNAVFADYAIISEERRTNGNVKSSADFLNGI